MSRDKTIKKAAKRKARKRIQPGEVKATPMNVRSGQIALAQAIQESFVRIQRLTEVCEEAFEEIEGRLRLVEEKLGLREPYRVSEEPIQSSPIIMATKALPTEEETNVHNTESNGRECNQAGEGDHDQCQSDSAGPHGKCL